MNILDTHIDICTCIFIGIQRCSTWWGYTAHVETPETIYTAGKVWLCKIVYMYPLLRLSTMNGKNILCACV